MRLYSCIRYSDLKHNQFVQLLVAGEAATEGFVVEAEGVVGIPDDKTRQHKEEVDGEIAIVNLAYDRGAGCKGKTLVDMIPQHEQSGYAAQAVEQCIMGL